VPDGSTDGSGPPTFRLWDAIVLPSVTNVVIAVAVALLAGAVVAAVVLQRDPVYRSAATLAIDQPQAIAASGDVGVIEKLNRLLPKYAALVRTIRISAPVAEATGAPPGQVAGSIGATPLGQALLLLTTAQSGDRAQARELAQATAEQVIAYADQEQEADSIPAEQRFHFELIQAAGPAAKISPSDDDAQAAGLVAAAIALVGTYVLAQVMTARRRL
jgi:capsular polysaccharide biosynthesis protein